MNHKTTLFPKSDKPSKFKAVQISAEMLMAANCTSENSNVTNLLSSRIFRVTDIVCEKVGNDQYRYEANLFSNQISIKVDWIDTFLNEWVCVGQLVSPSSGLFSNYKVGCSRITGLVVREQPNDKTNLFDLIPSAWVKDRSVVERGAELMKVLSNPHRMLFNAIFWNHERFERFCKQPSSMIGHHSEPSGNLKHTIEVAEEMRKYCSTHSCTNLNLGVLSALLHDAGKADEYVINQKGGWDLTDRGKLLGHKVTILEWIVAAVAKFNIELPQDHYIALLHIFTSIPSAPDWMGIREPAMHEGFVLSMYDRLSGRDDLVRRTLPLEGGYGKNHRHLKSTPFHVRGK